MNSPFGENVEQAKQARYKRVREQEAEVRKRDREIKRDIRKLPPGRHIEQLYGHLIGYRDIIYYKCLNWDASSRECIRSQTYRKRLLFQHDENMHEYIEVAFDEPID